MLAKLKLVYPLLLCFLLTGCYGKTELDDLAYVIAMGADIAPSGEADNLQITYQIAIPLKITGENSETGKETYTTYTTIAPSLNTANSMINTFASKDIDLSHVSLILYSQELAEKGLEGHVNSLISNVSIRPRTIISICEGSAKEFLEEVTPVLETSPARYYELLISSFHYTSRSVGTEILDFYTASQSIYQAPIAVKSKLGEENEAEFSGLAVFKGLQYVGEITEEEVMGHLLLTNKLTEATISFPYPQKEDKNVTITLKEHQKPKIKIAIENEIPKATITISVRAQLDSSGAPINFYEKETMDDLNEKIKDYIKQNVASYLKTTISFSADVAGLGRFAKRNYLTWPEFEKAKWKDIYSQLEYQIEVNSKLNVSQVIANTIPTTKQ